MIVCSECAESVSGIYVPESVCRMVLLVSSLLKTETKYTTVMVLQFSAGKVVCLIVPLLIKCSLLNCMIMQRTSLLVVDTAGSNTMFTVIQEA
jgi:hypothetical protein